MLYEYEIYVHHKDGTKERMCRRTGRDRRVVEDEMLKDRREFAEIGEVVHSGDRFDLRAGETCKIVIRCGGEDVVIEHNLGGRRGGRVTRGEGRGAARPLVFNNQISTRKKKHSRVQHHMPVSGVFGRY